MIVNKIVGISSFGMQYIGKEIKIETVALQFIFGCFRFSVGVEFAQNPVVFSQFVVNVAHQIVTVFIDFIVVSIAASVATELFVLAAYDSFIAF